MKNPDFESYLQEIHGKEIEDFGEWLQGLPIDTLITCANAYAIECCIKFLNERHKTP